MISFSVEKTARFIAVLAVTLVLAFAWSTAKNRTNGWSRTSVKKGAVRCMCSPGGCGCCRHSGGLVQ